MYVRMRAYRHIVRTKAMFVDHLLPKLTCILSRQTSCTILREQTSVLTRPQHSPCTYILHVLIEQIFFCNDTTKYANNYKKENTPQKQTRREQARPSSVIMRLLKPTTAKLPSSHCKINSSSNNKKRLTAAAVATTTNASMSSDKEHPVLSTGKVGVNSLRCSCQPLHFEGSGCVKYNWVRLKPQTETGERV